MALTTPDGESNAFEGGSFLSDRYKNLKQVNKGGQATIFRAIDQEHNRVVAVKRMDSEVSREAIDRWARCNNRSLIPLLDVIEEDEAVWLVMPWIEGKTLQEIQCELHEAAAQVRLEQLRRFISLISDFAKDVAAINRSGLIHNDLKSNNIIVASDVNALRLCDLTSNRALPVSNRNQAEKGSTRGTGGSRSDETRINSNELQFADINSLCRLVYSFVTNTRLPDGDAVAASHVMNEPIDVSFGDSSDFRHLVCSGLSKRLGSGFELSGLLDRWLANEPLETSPWPRKIKRSLQRSWAVYIPILMAIALAIASLSLWYQADSRRTKLALASTKTEQLEDSLASANQKRKEAQALSESRAAERDELMNSLLMELVDEFDPDSAESSRTGTVESFFGRGVEYAKSEESLSPNVKAFLLALGAKYYSLTENNKSKSESLFYESIDGLDDDFPRELLWNIRDFTVRAASGEGKGSLEKALLLVDRNLQEMEDAGKTNSDFAATTLVTKGDLLKELTDYEAAISSYRQALEIRNDVVPEKQFLIGNVEVRIGRTYERMRRFEEAKEWMERGRSTMATGAQDITERTFLLAAEGDLVRLRLLTDADMTEMLALVEELIPKFRAVFGETNTTTLTVENFKVAGLVKREDFAGASKTGKALIGRLPSGDQRISNSKEAAILNSYLPACILHGDEEEAIATYVRFDALIEDFPKNHVAKMNLTVYGSLLNIMSSSPTTKNKTQSSITSLRNEDGWPKPMQLTRALILAELAIDASDVEAAMSLAKSAHLISSTPRWVKAWRYSVLQRLGICDTAEEQQLKELSTSKMIPAGLKDYLKNRTVLSNDK